MLVGVDEDLISKAIEEIDKNYGSVDSFLREGLKLTDDDLQRLKDLYLEK